MKLVQSEFKSLSDRNLLLGWMLGLGLLLLPMLGLGLLLLLLLGLLLGLLLLLGRGQVRGLLLGLIRGLGLGMLLGPVLGLGLLLGPVQMQGMLLGLGMVLGTVLGMSLLNLFKRRKNVDPATRMSVGCLQQPNSARLADTVATTLVQLLPSCVSPEERDGVVSVMCETCQDADEASGKQEFYRVLATEAVELLKLNVYYRLKWLHPIYKM